MATNYPTGLDSYTAHTDGVNEVIAAATINALQDAVAALQAKVGVDASSVATTLDYCKSNTCVAVPAAFALGNASASSNAFKGCLFTPTASIHVHGMLIPLTTTVNAATYVGKVCTLASNAPGATTVSTVMGTSDTWTNGSSTAGATLEIPCTTKFTLTAGVTYALLGGITSGTGTTVLTIAAPPDQASAWPAVGLPGSFGANVVCAVNPPIATSTATVSATAGSRLWVGLVGHLV